MLHAWKTDEGPKHHVFWTQWLICFPNSMDEYEHISQLFIVYEGKTISFTVRTRDVGKVWVHSEEKH